MWSYFEDLIIRKIMVQSKFNLDARLNIIAFFNLEFACKCVMSSRLSSLHAYNLFCLVEVRNSPAVGLTTTHLICP
jgi:hypothetical protein